MRKLETEVLENVDCMLYVRYVDDTLLIASNHQIYLLLNKFNAFNVNIKFTLEQEVNKQLHVLDLTLIRTDFEIKTNWFTKGIFSGLTLNFQSKHPIGIKKSIVYNLVDRAMKLSAPEFHLAFTFQNLEKVKNILQ